MQRVPSSSLVKLHCKSKHGQHTPSSVTGASNDRVGQANKNNSVVAATYHVLTGIITTRWGSSELSCQIREARTQRSIIKIDRPSLLDGIATKPMLLLSVDPPVRTDPHWIQRATDPHPARSPPLRYETRGTGPSDLKLTTFRLDSRQ